METIKSVLGYGSVESQSGEEPLSGQTGAGTAAEPYDGGNATGEYLRVVLLVYVTVILKRCS